MNSVKKIFMILLVFFVMSFTFTGCFQNQNIVAVINDEKISESLYRIFLWQTQQGMESLNPNVWKLDSLGGKSPEEIAKDRALNSICYYVIAEEKAQELGIKINKDEKADINESAKKSIKENKDINESFGIRQKDYETFYRYMKIREKVLDVLGESYEPNEDEISSALSEEATIVQCFFSTKDEEGNDIPDDKKEEAYENALKVLQKAVNGEDLSELAVSYSEDPSVGDNKGVYTFSRGELDSALEEVVFEKASEGEVYPEIIETENGYEVIEVKSVSANGSDEDRKEVIKSLKLDYASNELLDMTKFAKTELKESYANIHLMKVADDE